MIALPSFRSLASAFGARRSTLLASALALASTLPTLGLTGCEGETERAPHVSSGPPVSSEITDYCTAVCKSMTCEDYRTAVCSNTCESWLQALDESCGDSVRAVFECQKGLNCADLEDAITQGRENEDCGDAYQEQTEACTSAESPGCEAYCESAIECIEEVAPTCMDRCVMNEARLEGLYGESCREAVDAVYECEAGGTCGDLQSLENYGVLVPGCEELADVADAECQ